MYKHIYMYMFICNTRGIKSAMLIKIILSIIAQVYIAYQYIYFLLSDPQINICLISLNNHDH